MVIRQVNYDIEVSWNLKDSSLWGSLESGHIQSHAHVVTVDTSLLWEKLPSFSRFVM